MQTVLRTAVAGVLAGSAKVLSFTSKLLDLTARTLRTPGPTQAPPDEPAPTTAADTPDHQRQASSHIEELAQRPASEVTAAIGDLSTDELRLLTEYELAHRKRKTVLAALEQAARP
ncbi:hypothetical protein BH24ACT14_BH24ACT14_11430 [soil metagenome]|jgi:hypothetical protein